MNPRVKALLVKYGKGWKSDYDEDTLEVIKLAARDLSYLMKEEVDEGHANGYDFQQVRDQVERINWTSDLLLT